MFFCFYLLHVYTKSKPLRITKEKHQRGDRCFLKAMQLKTQRKKKRKKKSGDSCRLIKLPSIFRSPRTPCTTHAKET